MRTASAFFLLAMVALAVIYALIRTAGVIIGMLNGRPIPLP
jgi:hypothetical protein